MTELTELRYVAQRLATPMVTPADDAAESVWDQWMDAVELDSLIGGWLAHVLADGRVDPSDLKAAQVRLVGNPQWREVISDRYELLVEAVNALAER